MTFILDGFGSGELALINPIHQLLWATALICYFPNLQIEKGPFSIFDDSLEHFSIIQTS